MQQIIFSTENTLHFYEELYIRSMLYAQGSLDWDANTKHWKRTFTMDLVGDTGWGRDRNLCGLKLSNILNFFTFLYGVVEFSAAKRKILLALLVLLL